MLHENHPTSLCQLLSFSQPTTSPHHANWFKSRWKPPHLTMPTIPPHHANHCVSSCKPLFFATDSSPYPANHFTSPCRPFHLSNTTSSPHHANRFTMTTTANPPPLLTNTTSLWHVAMQPLPDKHTTSPWQPLVFTMTTFLWQPPHLFITTTPPLCYDDCISP